MAHTGILGCVLSRNKSYHRLGNIIFDVFSGQLFFTSANFAYHDNYIRIGVFFIKGKHIDKG
jgi:hypothetical protein